MPELADAATLAAMNAKPNISMDHSRPRAARWRRRAAVVAATGATVIVVAVAPIRLPSEAPRMVADVRSVSDTTTTTPTNPGPSTDPWTGFHDELAHQAGTTTTTTAPPRPVVVHSARSAPPQEWVEAPVGNPTFWRELANCEDHDGPGVGKDGNDGGYFQFSSDTAAKLGYHSGMTYEEQRALAMEWARRIHPNEGSTSGWPNCWWVALNAVA